MPTAWRTCPARVQPPTWTQGLCPSEWCREGISSVRSGVPGRDRCPCREDLTACAAPCASAARGRLPGVEPSPPTFGRGLGTLADDLPAQPRRRPALGSLEGRLLGARESPCGSRVLWRGRSWASLWALRARLRIRGWTPSRFPGGVGTDVPRGQQCGRTGVKTGVN